MVLQEMFAKKGKTVQRIGEERAATHTSASTPISQARLNAANSPVTPTILAETNSRRTSIEKNTMSRMLRVR